MTEAFDRGQARAPLGGTGQTFLFHASAGRSRVEGGHSGSDGESSSGFHLSEKEATASETIGELAGANVQSAKGFTANCRVFEIRGAESVRHW